MSIFTFDLREPNEGKEVACYGRNAKASLRSVSVEACTISQAWEKVLLIVSHSDTGDDGGAS